MASSRDIVIPRESPWSSGRRRRDATSPRCSAQVSSKEVLDYLGFRDSKFMHAAFQLLGEPWDGSRMDFGETVKCIAQFCMFGMLTQRP